MAQLTGGIALLLLKAAHCLFASDLVASNVVTEETVEEVVEESVLVGTEVPLFELLLVVMVVVEQVHTYFFLQELNPITKTIAVVSMRFI